MAVRSGGRAHCAAHNRRNLRSEPFRHRQRLVSCLKNPQTVCPRQVRSARLDVFHGEGRSTPHGKVATYYARWASQRGETGPWSVPVSFRFAA
jgi:hypothetical protein